MTAESGPTATATATSTSTSTSTAELLDGLRRVLGAVEVVDLVRLSGGASRETWRFTADGRPLILQTQRAGDERDMGIEADVVRAAEAAGMPVPSLIASSNRPDELGTSFMVLTAIDGETIARKILRDVEFATARSLLTTDLAKALALLHGIPTTAVAGLVEIDQVGHYRAALEALQQPHPTFELAFRWLEQHRPVSSARSIVHGDFRLGNVIVGPGGLRAVIDWELAHIGDPMEDLGWMCVKAWRFGSRRPVAGVGDYDELFTAYEQAGGARVDPTSVLWWEVLGTLKWGIMCILQTTAHLSGASRSHELAAIGRRVCENEHDLFLALEGRW